MSNLLRPNQIEELQGERERLESALTAEDSRVDKAMARKQIRRLDHMLESQSPKPATGEDKDKLKKEETRLRRKILEGMPDEETMRKNPPGAVDAHMAWERANKDDIIKWKNTRLRLHAGEMDNTDVANLERYRPKGNKGLMANAQIPGHLSMQDVPQERYDLAFGDKEAKKAAIEALAIQLGMTPEKVKHKLGIDMRKDTTPEEKEQRKKALEKARAAKNSENKNEPSGED